jgi:hypothetical protein
MLIVLPNKQAFDLSPRAKAQRKLLSDSKREFCYKMHANQRNARQALRKVSRLEVIDAFILL